MALRLAWDQPQSAPPESVSGVGVPQMMAITESVRAADGAGIPIISDGGIRFLRRYRQSSSRRCAFSHDWQLICRDRRESPVRLFCTKVGHISCTVEWAP